MKALRLSLLPLFILISGQASEPPELEEFRLNFQIEISEAKAATKEFNSKYESYLEKQKTAYQAEGKLEAMLAVEKELENYESSTTLSSYPELKRLQEIYRKQMPQLASEEVAESLKVITAYREKAEQLAKQWTKDGKIEEAKSALAEAKRFEAMAEDLALVKLTTNPAPVVRSDDFGGREGGQETTNGLGMKLCWIPSGRFTMGSPPDEPERSGNELQVRVRITKGFWMGKYEVTQEEFEAVMEMNPSANRLGARGPVEQVRWTEAVLFGEKLTERERAEGRLPEGWIYRLPTEAEREYACRAGEEGRHPGGDLDDIAWYNANSDGRVHEVGGKKPNAWGLHDMLGNVSEWCLDWYAERYEGGNNPPGPTEGTKRIVRGGIYRNGTLDLRAADRSNAPPDARANYIGFRIGVFQQD